MRWVVEIKISGSKMSVNKVLRGFFNYSTSSGALGLSSSDSRSNFTSKWAITFLWPKGDQEGPSKALAIEGISDQGLCWHQFFYWKWQACLMWISICARSNTLQDIFLGNEIWEFAKNLEKILRKIPIFLFHHYWDLQNYDSRKT